MAHFVFPEGGGGRWIFDSNLALIANGILSLSSSGLQHWEVGAATPITLNVTPFGIVAPPDGTVIRVQGTSDINTVTLVHQDIPFGCKLFGTMVLKDDHIIEVVWRETEQRYLEVLRNA